MAWPIGPWSPPPAPLPPGPWPPAPIPPGPGEHPLDNTSFENAGVNLGEADYWTQGYHETGQQVALFQYSTLGETTPYEDFEGFWGNWPYNNNALACFVFDIGLVAALFESGHHDHENFETSWKEPKAGALWNHQSIWSFDLSGFSHAIFDSGIDAEEDFEHTWGSSPYCQASVYTFVIANFTQAAFDTGTDTKEDFENTWGSTPYNQASWYVYNAANFTKAMFDTGVDDEEDFEHSWITVLPV